MSYAPKWEQQGEREFYFLSSCCLEWIVRSLVFVQGDAERTDIVCRTHDAQ
jgi:hypothetical protein